MSMCTSLMVFLSVARGKVSVPQAVTPSYTWAYHAALLRDLFFTYLVLLSSDVPPAVSPAMSSGGCRHLSSGFRSLQASGRMGDGMAGNLKMTKSDIH
ncbi:unnamed protein product [Staurois parvus]|uniref:Secreted protein n=1 Tax=Staurois parvus TaxID=386267 RepID=A0ABN9B9R6_9NEOB|nr:unnamed protein product [Staurois parvus]